MSEEFEGVTNITRSHRLADVYEVFDAEGRTAVVENTCIPPIVIWAEEGFDTSEYGRSFSEILLDMHEEANEVYKPTAHWEKSTDNDVHMIVKTDEDDEPYLDIDPVVEHTKELEEPETISIEEFADNLGVDLEQLPFDLGARPHKYKFPNEGNWNYLTENLHILSKMVDHGTINETEYREAVEQRIVEFREKYNFTKSFHFEWPSSVGRADFFAPKYPTVVEGSKK